MNTFRSYSSRIVTGFSVILLGMGTALLAQPNLSWVRTGTTGSSCTGRALAVDAAGNVWVAGRMYGTVDFGSTNVTAYNGSPDDGFLAKYAADGRLLWAGRMGGPSTDQATGLAVDAAGNAYVTGFYNGTAYFDPTNINATYGNETFVAKYDSNGALSWVVRCGGSGPGAWGSVALDGAGHVYVTGSLNGAGVFGNTNITSAGTYDAFVTKLTPDGQFRWVRAFGGRGYTYGRAIAVDAAGSVAIAGAFTDTAMVGERCLLSRGGEDVFVARLDSNGDPLWARSGGGGSGDGAYSVALDGAGHTYVGGYFNGTASFETSLLVSQGGNEPLLIKYDDTGREAWVLSFAGNGDDVITSLAANREGIVHLAGYHASSPLVFDGTNLFTVGGYDAFAAKVAPDRHVRWVLRVGGGNSEFGHALALDSAGNVHLSGQFAYNLTLVNTNLNNPSSEGMFVTRWNRDLPVITTQPVGAVVMESTELTLSAAVTGTGPFSFQWTHNGQDIPGATNGPSLPLFAATWHNGNYQLIACNYEGCVTSAVATITVYTLAEGADADGLQWTSGGHVPWFNQTNVTFDGVDALRSGALTNSQQSWLQTEVRGTARVSFQWRISSENGYDFLRFTVNGVEVTNTSGKIEWKPLSFLLGPGVSVLQWTYTKDESESVGLDAGWVDAVSVVYAPSIFAGPVSQVVTAGMTAEFGVVLSGTPPIQFQWERNGVALASATNQTLVLPNAGPGEAGQYVLTASNSAGTVTSAPVQLTVRVPPAITSQPASQTVGLGGSVTLSVTGNGGGGLAYQWRFNGTDIPGATEGTLVLTNLQMEMAGAYSVLVSSVNGNTLSEPALVNLTGLVMRPTVFIAGVVGRTYRIEFAYALAPSNWMPLTNLVLPSNPYHYVDFSAEGQRKRFYRVLSE